MRGLRRYLGAMAVAIAISGGPAAAQTWIVAQATSNPSFAALRGELFRLLTQYPPSLTEELRLDPSLLSNKEFLASYPSLQMFIAAHPEIVRNSGFFLGPARQYSQQYVYDPARVASEITTPMAVTLVLGSLIAAIAWIVRSIIEYRRWLRISKIQTEAHSKLLDRFTSSEALLAYIDTSAGKKFLEADLTPSSGTRVGAPVGRILFSVQVGVVLGFAGLGVLYASRSLESELVQPFFVLGVLGIALSIGFVLSALAAYAISRSLGLIRTPQEHNEAASPPA